jgi:hypothetical protein
MANPLQPKILKVLRTEYGAYAINLVASASSGDMDIICCIKGLFYGFEVKWADDKPSELQKKKINACIDAGGKAFFVRSVQSLRNILDNDLNPVYYDIKPEFIL